MLLASCGGKAGIDHAASCLDGKGLIADQLTDPYPVLEVDTASNHAKITFAPDAEGADTVVLGAGPLEALGEVTVRRHGNVVVEWKNPPTDDEVALVEGCI